MSCSPRQLYSHALGSLTHLPPSSCLTRVLARSFIFSRLVAYSHSLFLPPSILIHSLCPTNIMHALSSTFSVLLQGPVDLRHSQFQAPTAFLDGAALAINAAFIQNPMMMDASFPLRLFCTELYRFRKTRGKTPEGLQLRSISIFRFPGTGLTGTL